MAGKNCTESTEFFVTESEGGLKNIFEPLADFANAKGRCRRLIITEDTRR
jgi:hypothetical protein